MMVTDRDIYKENSNLKNPHNEAVRVLK